MARTVWTASMVSACLAGQVVMLLASENVNAADTEAMRLFNGRDLSGWEMGPDKSWLVDDGVITIHRELDGQEHNQ